MLATMAATKAARHAIPDHIMDKFADLVESLDAFAELIAASDNFSASVFSPSN